MAWTISAARQSGVVDRVVLSTDDPQIAEIGAAEGAVVPFLRPPELAQDTTPMSDVVRHAIEAESAAGYPPTIIVLLQPTSPLRRAAHIREAVETLRASGCDSVVSVVSVPAHLCPDYVMTIRDGLLTPFLREGAQVTRRQDVRPAWYRDGTIYAFRRASFERYGTIYGLTCRPMIIDQRLSGTIDTIEDFEEIESRFGLIGSSPEEDAAKRS